VSSSTAQTPAGLGSPLLNHATFAARVSPVFGLGLAATIDSAPDRMSGEVALLARVPARPPRGSRSRSITGESALLGRVD
jgi:hypothetical protein